MLCEYSGYIREFVQKKKKEKKKKEREKREKTRKEKKKDQAFISFFTILSVSLYFVQESSSFSKDRLQD